MKKHIKLEWVYIAVLVISLILSIVTGVQIAGEVVNVRRNLSEQNMGMNAFVYGKYIDSYLTNRVELLNTMADCIAQLGSTDPDDLHTVLVGQNEFSRICLLNNEGKKICGANYEVDNLKDKPFYDTLMQGKNVVAPSIEVDTDDKEVLRFYAPVQKNGKTVMTITAGILTQEIKTVLNEADYKGDGALCIVNGLGDYVLGDNDYESMLKNRGGNHFSYLNSCQVLDGVSSVDELEERMENQLIASVDYQHAGVKYSAQYVPLSVNNWYAVTTMPMDSFGSTVGVVSTGTIVLTVISVIFILIFLAMSAYIMVRNIKLRTENERHNILEQCDQSVSFQVTFRPHKMEFYGDVKSIIGTEIGNLSGEAVYDIYDWIHEDDYSLRGRMSSFWEGEDTKFNTEVRIRNIKGTYRWYRIVGILERNEFGANESFVGKIVNVDEELSEEKELVQRAENDMLTGVLNKKTMEKRVSLMLKNRGDKYVIFYMVDLDNFKNVNDTLGHIYGDQAIVETAQCLNKVFANQDCIGRLGGDEFAVCVSYQAFDEQGLLEFIGKKAQEICAGNRRTYTDNAASVSITSSIGVAYAPDMRDSFTELYTQADCALYYSKANGKDQYHIYSPKDDN